MFCVEKIQGLTLWLLQLKSISSIVKIPFSVSYPEKLLPFREENIVLFFKKKCSRVTSGMFIHTFR